jgi:hypothetical protein
LTRVQRSWDLEPVTVQTLIKLTHPRAVEEQDLQRILPTAEEHEERTTARLAAHACSSEVGQPVEAPPQVDRLQTDKDVYPMRNQETPAFNARPTATSTSSRRAHPIESGTCTRSPPTLTTTHCTPGSTRDDAVPRPSKHTSLRGRTMRASQSDFAAATGSDVPPSTQRPHAKETNQWNKQRASSPRRQPNPVTA